MTGPVVLALEGPPGAGKTTLLGALVPALGDDVLFFTEPNIKLNSGTCAPVHSAPAAQTLWYLRQETARAQALRTTDSPAVVCDRNHLGVLAYAFAARGEAALPYRKAVAYYRQHIKPLYSTRVPLRTVILLVSVATSLQRRGGRPAHPRWRQWYDPGLLERMTVFYTKHAPDLCPHPPLVIDTTLLTPSAVILAVAGELRAAGADVSARLAAAPVAPAVDARFTAHYRELGGAAVLGGTVTDAFTYRGGLMQMFQLAALVQHHGRTRLWNPFDTLPIDDPTGALPCPTAPLA